MKFSEYRRLAQRTSSTTTKDDKIIHGYLGLLGEIGEGIDVCKKNMFLGMSYEMAKEKLLDELGDICWYIAELATGYDYNIDKIDVIESEKGILEWISTFVQSDIPFVAKSLSVLMELVLREARRSIQYGFSSHGYSVALVSFKPPITNYYLAVIRIAKSLDYDISDVFEYNIEKLKKRYPSGFDAEASNARYEGDDK